MDGVKANYFKYSDDGTCYITGPTSQLSNIESTLSNDLQMIINWCTKWRMPINLGKTKYIVFSRSNTPTPEANIRCKIAKPNNVIDDIKIEKTSEMRILGLTLDEKLTFEPHVDYLTRISYNNLNKIQDFINRNIGIPTKMAIILYKAYIRSVIEYNYICWCTITEDKMNIIERIQATVLKRILQIKGQVSFNALNVECGILPIKLRLNQQLAHFVCKIFRKNDGDEIKKMLTENMQRNSLQKYITPANKVRMVLKQYSHKDLNLTDLEPEPNLKLKKISHIEPLIFTWDNIGNANNRTVDQAEQLKEKTERFIANINQQHIICFTDGSVTNPDAQGLGLCDAGSVIYTQGIRNPPTIIKTPVGKKATAYQGELSAILSVLERLTMYLNHRAKKIYIITDSQSALQAITKYSRKENNSINIIEKIQEKASILKENDKIVYISWTGGHNNIEGMRLQTKQRKKQQT